jgi:hypothetical protein
MLRQFEMRVFGLASIRVSGKLSFPTRSADVIAYGRCAVIFW